MANVVLTRSCNRACSFCFAPNDSSAATPIEEVLGLARRLRSEGKHVVPLVGGEPTLHPEFSVLVEAILELGMGVRVFTHGQLGKRALATLTDAPDDKVSVVVNATATLSEAGSLHPRVLDCLQAMSVKASLGVTLDRLDRPYHSLLPLYERYGLKPTFRLGIAQPILGEPSDSTLDYRAPGLGALVTTLALTLSERQIATAFDCGLVMCMFSPEQRRQLAAAGIHLQSLCAPIPDIGRDGLAWPCYPLAPRYTTRLLPGDSLAQLRRRMSRQLAGFRAAGLYPECMTCEFKLNGACTGGCLGRVGNTFIPLETLGRESARVTPLLGPGEAA